MTKCPRCNKEHNSPPYNEQDALDRAGDILAKEIDKEALLYAAKLHDTNIEYGIGTREAYELFNKKRNYPIK
jgi:hypothetical protein